MAITVRLALIPRWDRSGRRSTPRKSAWHEAKPAVLLDALIRIAATAGWRCWRGRAPTAGDDDVDLGVSYEVALARQRDRQLLQCGWYWINRDSARTWALKRLTFAAIQCVTLAITAAKRTVRAVAVARPTIADIRAPKWLTPGVAVGLAASAPPSGRNPKPRTATMSIQRGIATSGSVSQV